MREIKFRAWMNEWDEGGRMFYKIISLTPNFNEVQISLDGGNGYDGDFTVGKDVELMQYTGLKDKNGKEIYEGDYVKTTYHTNKVEHFGLVDWVDHGFGIRRKITETGSELQVFGAAPLPDSSRIEVIGNIYENPELLK